MMLVAYSLVLSVILVVILTVLDRRGTLPVYSKPSLGIFLEEESEGIIEAASVPKIVWQIYYKVLTDHDLAPYFNGANTPRIVNKQIEMFRAIGSGNVIPYSREHLGSVHKHLNVRDEHFTKLLELIREVYAYYEVPPATVVYVIGLLETYRSVIVNDLDTGSTTARG